MSRRKYRNIHSFFSSIKKKGIKKIGKNRKEIAKSIRGKLRFIDSVKFLLSSLSNPAANLSGGIHKTKCKYRQDK